MLRVEQTSGGYKNVTLQIVGMCEGDMSFTEIECPTRNLRLESAVWVVQEKLGVVLQWTQSDPFLIMESRNSLRFDVGIHSPKDWDGRMWLKTVGFANPPTETKQFLIVLDFDK